MLLLRHGSRPSKEKGKVTGGLKQWWGEVGCEKLQRNYWWSRRPCYCLAKDGADEDGRERLLSVYAAGRSSGGGEGSDDGVKRSVSNLWSRVKFLNRDVQEERVAGGKIRRAFGWLEAGKEVIAQRLQSDITGGVGQIEKGADEETQRSTPGLHIRGDVHSPWRGEKDETHTGDSSLADAHVQNLDAAGGEDKAGLASRLLRRLSAVAAAVGVPYSGSNSSEYKATAMSDSLAETPRTSSSIPLTFESFGREFVNATAQDNFDGFRLEASKPLTERVQFSSSLLLGTSLRDSGYLFQGGPTYTTEDGGLLAAARCGTDGMVNARVVKKLSEGYEAKCQLNTSLKEDQRDALELGLDCVDKDWTGGIKAIWQGAWILSGSYSHVVLPRLQLGGELLWVSSNQASIGTVGARYAADQNIFTGQLTRQPDFKGLMNGFGPSNSHSLKLQHVNKISDRLSLASEFEFSHPDKFSALRTGYEYSFRQARVQGMIDTSGKVSAFAQDYSGFGVSGVIDYLRGDYKFGFVMHMLPAQQKDEQKPQTS